MDDEERKEEIDFGSRRLTVGEHTRGALAWEVEDHRLRNEIPALLGIGNKIGADSDSDLEDWPVDYIRHALRRLERFIRASFHPEFYQADKPLPYDRLEWLTQLRRDHVFMCRLYVILRRSEVFERRPALAQLARSFIDNEPLKFVASETCLESGGVGAWDPGSCIDINIPGCASLHESNVDDEYSETLEAGPREKPRIQFLSENWTWRLARLIRDLAQGPRNDGEEAITAEVGLACRSFDRIKAHHNSLEETTGKVNKQQSSIPKKFDNEHDVIDKLITRVTPAVHNAHGSLRRTLYNITAGPAVRKTCRRSLSNGTVIGEYRIRGLMRKP